MAITRLTSPTLNETDANKLELSTSSSEQNLTWVSEGLTSGSFTLRSPNGMSIGTGAWHSDGNFCRLDMATATSRSWITSKCTLTIYGDAPPVPVTTQYFPVNMNSNSNASYMSYTNGGVLTAFNIAYSWNVHVTYPVL